MNNKFLKNPTFFKFRWLTKFFNPTKRSYYSRNDKIIRHEQISKIIHNASIFLGIFCLFNLLILGQQDSEIFSGKIDIPFAGVKIDTHSFFYFCPLILFIITIYVHIYIDNLFKITNLKITDKYPYLFNQHNKIANFMSIALQYLMPIFVAILFTWKSLPFKPAIQFFNILITGSLIIIFIFLAMRRLGRLNRLRNTMLYLLWVLLFASSIFFGHELFVRLNIFSGNAILNRSFSLIRADLRNKVLTGINIDNSNLHQANMTNIELNYSSLRNTILSQVILRNGKLYYANLSNSMITNSVLDSIDLREANLDSSNFNKSFLSSANLHSASLVRSDLSETVLENAQLANTKIANSNFTKSKLNLSTFRLANIDSTRFRYAFLFFTEFRNTNAPFSDFYWANMDSCRVFGSNLELSNFYLASIKGGLFLKSNLRNVILTRANLFGAKFIGSDLKYSDLESASLKNSSFMGVDLRYADFRWANLDSVDLSGANVSGANFQFTEGLTEAQLMSAIGWESSYRDSFLLCGKDLPVVKSFSDTIIKFVFKKDEELPYSDFDNFHISRSSFENSYMYGSKFRYSNISNSIYRSSNIRRSSFQNAKISNVNFVNCNLIGADFNQAELQNVNFISCDLRYAVFKNIIFKNVNFTNSEISYAEFNDTKELKLSDLYKASGWELSYRDSSLSLEGHINNKPDERLIEARLNYIASNLFVIYPTPQ